MVSPQRRFSAGFEPWSNPSWGALRKAFREIETLLAIAEPRIAEGHRSPVFRGIDKYEWLRKAHQLRMVMDELTAFFVLCGLGDAYDVRNASTEPYAGGTHPWYEFRFCRWSLAKLVKWFRDQALRALAYGFDEQYRAAPTSAGQRRILDEYAERSRAITDSAGRIFDALGGPGGG